MLLSDLVYIGKRQSKSWLNLENQYYFKAPNHAVTHEQFIGLVLAYEMDIDNNRVIIKAELIEEKYLYDLHRISPPANINIALRPQFLMEKVQEFEKNILEMDPELKKIRLSVVTGLWETKYNELIERSMRYV